jgi:outer membrane cobalamin receptor
MHDRKIRRLGQGWVNCCGLLLGLLGCAGAGAQTTKEAESKQTSSSSSSPRGDLTQFSLEKLMNMEVTSVSKKEQKLSEVAAAIFVIRAEDIRHSGATNIPDQLRMVPGLDVAQIFAAG